MERKVQNISMTQGVATAIKSDRSTLYDVKPTSVEKSSFNNEVNSVPEKRELHNEPEAPILINENVKTKEEELGDNIIEKAKADGVEEALRMLADRRDEGREDYKFDTNESISESDHAEDKKDLKKQGDQKAAVEDGPPQEVQIANLQARVESLSKENEDFKSRLEKAEILSLDVREMIRVLTKLVEEGEDEKMKKSWTAMLMLLAQFMTSLISADADDKKKEKEEEKTFASGFIPGN